MTWGSLLYVDYNAMNNAALHTYVARTDFIGTEKNGWN